jgi:NADH dehydrogenase/NADH:ubiquinone oxidoreductase subunit G
LRARGKRRKLMVTLTIDGVEVKTQDGTTILEASRNVSGVGTIPTLCHNDSPAFRELKPVKTCRVCTVEIVEGDRSRFSLACITLVKDGMVVLTNSESVKERRKEIVGKHLQRCPNVRIIQDLAKEVGATLPEGELEDEECILCGMCQRACSDPRGIGMGAISLVKQDGVSYYQVNEEECFGCGDCMMACALGSIKLGEVAILPKPKALK